MKRLTRTVNVPGASTWVSANGNFVIGNWDWRSQPWVARWTDVFGAAHEITGHTREDLARALKPYGMSEFVLGRSK